MKYKVGQKYRIKTWKEVKSQYPDMTWNHHFFEKNANEIFTVKEVESYKNINDVWVHGCTEDIESIVLSTREKDDVILKNASLIELDNDLFQL